MKHATEWRPSVVRHNFIGDVRFRYKSFGGRDVMKAETGGI
jgi:hypothetical protein